MCEKPNIKKLSKRNLTSMVTMLFATIFAVIAILVDSLSIFRHENDKIFAVCSRQTLKYTDQYTCNDTIISITPNSNVNSITDSNDTSTDSSSSTISSTSYDDSILLSSSSFYGDFSDDLNGTFDDIIYDCLERSTNYAKRCNDKLAWDNEDWCDTEYAGIYWFYSSIAGCSMIFINIIWNLFDYPKIGGTFGFCGWLGLIIAVSCWIGLTFDFSFEFDGNSICFNKDSWYLDSDNNSINDYDGARFDIGDSLFIMFGSIVLSLAGWYMSCVANMKTDEELEMLEEV